MYAKIPFGIMNAGATFQRAMDLDFVGIKDKFVLIYLDDLTVYSYSHLLSTQLALLHLSANTSYVGTQKDTYGLKVS